MEQHKGIKYVIVTAHMKGETKLDTQGYLVAYKTLVEKEFEVVKTTDMFIQLFRKGSIHMFNTKYYYISELQIASGDSVLISSLNTFNDTVEEQTDAINKIMEVIESLKSEGYLKYNDFIDYEKYSDVPAKLKEDIDASNRTILPKSSGGYTPPNNIYGNSANNWQSATSYVAPVRKVVSTIMMKRTTTYDVAKALEAMAAKIKEMQAGTYVLPGPKIKAEEDEPKVSDDNIDIVQDGVITDPDDENANFTY
jgi:hypothetical protein